MRSQGLSYVEGVVAVAATLWLMLQARGVLEPLLISILLCYVLRAMARAYARFIAGEGAEPSWRVQVLAAVTLVLVLIFLVSMVSDKAAQLRANLPTYEANIDRMVARVSDTFGLSTGTGLDALIEKIDFTAVALSVAGSTAGFLSGFVIILVYIVFIFLEASSFREKLAAISSDPGSVDRVLQTVDEINKEIETYMGVKCLVGIVQAVPTYLVLWIAGVDGAVFWAVLIFFFSFVPTIGTLIGIAFPAVMTLVQFAEPAPFLLVTGALAAVQLAGSNWLEPRLMGQSLNLSPLVILISIFGGGAIWGITGALVAVPVLSVTVIIFSRLERMRPVAILLSSDGKI